MTVGAVTLHAIVLLTRLQDRCDPFRHSTCPCAGRCTECPFEALRPSVQRSATRQPLWALRQLPSMPSCCATSALPWHDSAWMTGNPSAGTGAASQGIQAAPLEQLGPGPGPCRSQPACPLHARRGRAMRHPHMPHRFARLLCCRACVAVPSWTCYPSGAAFAEGGWASLD